MTKKDTVISKLVFVVGFFAIVIIYGPLYETYSHEVVRWSLVVLAFIFFLVGMFLMNSYLDSREEDSLKQKHEKIRKEAGEKRKQKMEEGEVARRS